MNVITKITQMLGIPVGRETPMAPNPVEPHLMVSLRLELDENGVRRPFVRIRLDDIQAVTEVDGYVCIALSEVKV